VLPDSGGDVVNSRVDPVNGAGGAYVSSTGGSGPQTEATGGCAGTASTDNGGSVSNGGANANCNCGTGGAKACPVGQDVCQGSSECIPLTSAEHCGSCDNNCVTPGTENSTNWGCNDFACVAQCKANFADCDKMPGNGCEVDLSSDPAHCGACTNSACDYPICSNGACSRVFVVGNPAVPSELTPTVGVKKSTVFGVRQMLNFNDAIVSFGAVTNASTAFSSAKFQMAIYDSDSNNMPQSMLLSTAMPEYSDTADMFAKDGLVEQKLIKPFYMPYQGQNWYWILMWVENVDDLYLVITNTTQNTSAYADVRSASGITQWPNGTGWQSGFTEVPPFAHYGGFSPHIFARYTPAPSN